ncbi:MAG: Phosphoribosylaminoimidazole-succinocarboxamide synthase [Acidobacteria bacterium ADurb.Bin051]|nr:MAG: Phosphoribosylaminoimidazole-succinocarboxamide synthase [Acidobacteria bacterium ADurb.Bin051]
MDLKRVLQEKNFVAAGKSKEIYRIPNGEYRGKYAFVFTDRATGYLDAEGRPVFDPGCDVVVGEIPGKGAIACRFATHFFRLLAKMRVPTHYVATVADDVMVVEPAVPLGMPARGPEFPGAAPLQNLEWTWRESAMGSFWRRYPFVRPCTDLPRVVEAWTKGATDQLITFEALAATGALSRIEIRRCERFVQRIAAVIHDEFARHGLHVLDGKIELGRTRAGDGRIVLIDEISPDVLRVCRGYRPGKQGCCLEAVNCIRTRVEGERRRISARNQLSAAELEAIFASR